MKPRIVLFLTVAAVLVLSGCATKIGRINMDPSHYRNRTVRISGVVTNSLGALGTGGYQVDDGTGRIYVLSAGAGVPNRGSRVRVTGTVTPGANVFGRSIGTAIREQHHKVRF